MRNTPRNITRSLIGSARGTAPQHDRRPDAGLTTAEYAVGTVAVTGLAALLLRLVTSDWMSNLLRSVIESGFGAVN